MTGIVIIVQARMGSSRRPGKVLAELHGMPMLLFLLERLKRADVGPVVVATSDLPSDNPVADLAESRGFLVVRGSEQDVLARLVSVLEMISAEDVVRITADCPLTDPELIRDCLDLHRRNGSDYTSNVLVRTYPDGLDVEVVRADVLVMAAQYATDAREREHVTPYLYRRPESYRLTALLTPALLGHLRCTVDTEADLIYLRSLVAELKDPLTAGWKAVVSCVTAGELQPRGMSFRPRGVGDDTVELCPLLPGQMPEVEGWWAPLGDESRRVPDGQTWWGKVLQEGGIWSNCVGEPFTRAWSLNQGGKMRGWLAVEHRNLSNLVWGAADPRVISSARRGLHWTYQRCYPLEIAPEM